MSVSSRENVLSRYHYDPLDRQRGCTLSQQPAIQRFYCKSRLSTETQGVVYWSIIQHDDQLLALRQAQSGTPDTALLVTDQKRSVFNVLANTQPHPLAYSPYGHHPAENGLLNLLGFNGERPDPVTGHYHLGNGYRQFNPVLMRFNSPDSWSPFGEGGLNAYGYCGGDPNNRTDSTGHMFRSTINFINKIFKPKIRPSSHIKLTDLTADSFGAISQYLPSSDMNNLRLVSKEVNAMANLASDHNFAVFLNKKAPNIFFPKSSATPLDKVIEVGLGRIPGISSSAASNTISLNMAKNLFETHATSGYSYTPRSLIANQTLEFSSSTRPRISHRHSIATDGESVRPVSDKNRERFPEKGVLLIRRGSF